MYSPTVTKTNYFLTNGALCVGLWRAELRYNLINKYMVWKGIHLFHFLFDNLVKLLKALHTMLTRVTPGICTRNISILQRYMTIRHDDKNHSQIHVKTDLHKFCVLHTHVLHALFWTL